MSRVPKVLVAIMVAVVAVTGGPVVGAAGGAKPGAGSTGAQAASMAPLPHTPSFVKQQGGFQGFNPQGGFQGFNPQAFQGFNPPITSNIVPPVGTFPIRRHHPVIFVSPFIVTAPPVVVFTPPPVVYSPPPVVYLPPPVAYYPPSPPAPPGPPIPAVIEYSHGRYELRGDGVTTPYRWVWIPNPPPPPPPPTAPPEAPQSTPPTTPESAPAAPSVHSRIYSWTDERGVTTFTDSEQKVPERYRAKPKREPTNSI